MTRQITMATRKVLISAVGQRYHHTTHSEKRHILNEFVALTLYHPKHTIGLLRRQEEAYSASRPARHLLYGEVVARALVALWEASDQVYSKRLDILVPILIVKPWSVTVI